MTHRMTEPYYHGGFPGLKPGDAILPAPPHVFDGCPICLARRAGVVCTVGVFRAWAIAQGPKASHVVRMLRGVPDHEPIDPPSAENAVYVSTSQQYARFYASRSRGDLYEVVANGPLTPSAEDHFESFTTDSATVVRVLERRVRLTRRERRQMTRDWKKADRLAEVA